MSVVQKELDWVPVSSALLVTGAMALSFASLLSPTGGDSSDSLSIVEQHDGRWLAVAVIYFIASVTLTLGLPSVLSLFDRRGSRMGTTSAVVLSVGFIGTAGFAMLLVFFRALVITGSVVDKGLGDVTKEAGLSVFLYGWIAAFYLGELLLGIALLMARTTPRWIPLLLIAHVLFLPLQSVLPAVVGKATILLLAVGFAGIAIEAVARDNGRPRH
ncbi:MAG: hypothetical protein JWN22_1060 [Nocardioides sp.]|nr:hypothetical protein [Nocardioides sp.]